MTFDETILTLVALDPLLLLAQVRPKALRRVGSGTTRTESGLYDDGDKPVGRFVLAAHWTFEQGRLEIRAQLTEGWLSFEPMERVTRVDEEWPMSFLDLDGRSVATRAWEISTSRGNCYSGVSVTRGGLAVLPAYP